MKENRIRTNFGIMSPYVRVIGPDKKQIGIMPTKEACELARRQGLDLIEIAPHADPPVCLIADFGKYMYQLKQKERQAKKKGSGMKEIRVSYKMDEHDYQTKLRKIKELLTAKERVKVVLKMRGRESLYKERAVEFLNRLTEDISGLAVPERPPQMIGESGKIMQITYLPKGRRYETEDLEIVKEEG
jgi:translation initiation factor IF-3